MAKQAARASTGSKKKQVALAAAKPAAEPSYEQIERRAFELFLERGGLEGSAMGDWLRAEAELRAS